MQTIMNAVPYGLLPGQTGIELFADRTTRKMHFLQDGKRLAFKDLPREVAAKLFDQMMSDEKAMVDLKGLPLNEAFEKYCFCVYGAADSNPDVDVNGNLQPSDNFMCGENCTCVKWKTKSISIDGIPITPRQLQVINALNSDDTDVLVAHKLGISKSTLNTTKKMIFEKFNVYSTTALVAKAIQNKIIQ